jgi:Cu(I)/Ag(I) efflux system membrane fusion protein
MKYAISGSLLLVMLAGSGAVMAGEHGKGMNHADMQNMKQPTSVAQGHKAEGAVNGVDLQHGKINMTHGPVSSLGWPGMTMDFAVKDKSILKGLKVGQKVQFEIVQEGPGQFYVSRITPLK